MVVIPTLCKTSEFLFQPLTFVVILCGPTFKMLLFAIMLVFELGDLIWDQKELNWTKRETFAEEVICFRDHAIS